ncbi:SGNH/GDSL hydrolase family protein [Desertivirga brevis]|uniref:SGNH/GDSL hydrolase family protein n=1 Tax=Desertivirga brevis TaxID=2810310 RepID=UPI001A96F7D0|nr:SGNH/GDSL hydrolase family protein [Pedobacter sp. SYSU D00873]
MINFLKTFKFYNIKSCSLRFLLSAYFLTSFIIFCNAKTISAKPKPWVGTWGAAPQLVEPGNMPPAPGLTNNTLRQVVCVSRGGKKLQLKFSNEFGNESLTMKAVHIAVSGQGNTVELTTQKALMFNGRPEVRIAPGETATSDAVIFELTPRMRVAVTIFFGTVPERLTGHPGSRTTSYLLEGDQSRAEADFTKAVRTDHWYILSGIDVEGSKSAGAVVTFGDSITDGRGSGTNEDNRWPDILSINLLKNPSTRHIGVINMGIGGNAVLRGGLGQPGLHRFDRDVLSQKGVKWLIILEGVNDLGPTRDSSAAAKVVEGLIAAYQIMIDKAHARGIKVYGGTITPFKNAAYYRPYRENARNEINAWIRSSGRFDAIIDFDKAVRNPEDPEVMLNKLQDDFLHPNRLGYQVMGNAIEINLFK